mmetsp:Transcript_1280/g.5062  ORF Transcript_1280/g.5062 Transcript_1280/m.5062 type:complete len:218 (+) Transcript_1280:1144-1797(+)
MPALPRLLLGASRCQGQPASEAHRPLRRRRRNSLTRAVIPVRRALTVPQGSARDMTPATVPRRFPPRRPALPDAGRSQGQPPAETKQPVAWWRGPRPAEGAPAQRPRWPGSQRCRLGRVPGSWSRSRAAQCLYCLVLLVQTCGQRCRLVAQPWTIARCGPCRKAAAVLLGLEPQRTGVAEHHPLRRLEQGQWQHLRGYWPVRSLGPAPFCLQASASE